LQGGYQNLEGQKFINRLSTLIFYMEIREIVSQKDPGKFITREI
jgi:cob(I)alamin adenosyltransferase